MSKQFYIILVLSIFAFIICLLQSSNIYLWDEAVFLSSAENLGKTTPYYTEIDYRPPLIILLINWLSFLINIETGANIIAALFFALGVLGIFLLTKEIFNEKAGIIASLLFLTAPYFIHWAPKVMNDVPAVTLSLFLFYFLFKWKNENKRIFLLISGLFAGISILMRFTSLMFVPLAILFILLIKLNFKEKVKNVLLFGISSLVPLIPYIWWVEVTQGSFIKLLRWAQKVAAESIPPVPNPLFYFNATIVIIALPTLFGLLLYTLNLIKNKKIYFNDVFLIFWFVSFFVYFTTIAHKEIRYLLPAIPPLFVLSAYGYSKIKKNLKNIFLILAVLLLIASYFSFGYYSSKDDFGEEIMLKRSSVLIPAAEYIKENIPENYVVYSHSLYPVIAFHSKREVIATWPWDEGFYEEFPQNMKNDGYYVHIEGIEKEPTKEWLDESSYFKKIKEFESDPKIIIYGYHHP